MYQSILTPEQKHLFNHSVTCQKFIFTWYTGTQTTNINLIPTDRYKPVGILHIKQIQTSTPNQQSLLSFSSGHNNKPHPPNNPLVKHESC